MKAIIRQTTGRPLEISLVTGFPAFTATQLTRRLLSTDSKERVNLLVAASAHAEVDAFLASLPAAHRRRVRVLEGAVADMDLGLGGGEYKALAAELTSIHHTAALYFHEARREVVERVNVEGTRTILELAADAPHLRRLTHWSTAQISGKRAGVILEEEFDCGQRFHNIYEESKFAAERMVRAAARRLPVTVVRPSIIVGDSATGEIDRFDGPYYLLVLIVSSPVNMHLPLPGRGQAPLNLVPIDYVVNAAVYLSREARASGGTFHLTDPSPLSARSVYELVARHAERKAPRGVFPLGLARALLRAPGLERLMQAPRALFEAFNQPAVYNCRHTLALLEESGLRCPPFDSYVEQLVRHVREAEARRQAHEDEASDPFE